MLNIVTASSEIVPLAKTGGLGDVCGALPIELAKLGCKCTAFLPAYRSVLKSGFEIERTPHTFTIYINDAHVTCRLLKTRFPNSEVDIYLIDQPQYFDREGLYFDRRGEYKDNCERFSFFCRSVAEAIDRLGIDVDILHTHDWQTGLLPAFLKTRFGHYNWMDRAKSVHTIHNLAYQGRFWHHDMPLTGLDWRFFNYKQMEFHGDLNLLKTGIVFADAVSTVSPTYAQEITEPELGCGLNDILASRGEDLVGIVNGVDYTQWDPAVDVHIPKNFSVENWREGKAVCKAALQEELGLPTNPDIPLIGIVSRIADQKGWDLIIPLLHSWAEHRDVQWAILGTGDPKHEQSLTELASKYPERVGLKLAFSEGVAHRIEAASDMFLMPSQYEPCGLNQLYSLRYGAVPVVTATGGLKDTVVHSSGDNLANNTATGFQIEEYSLDELTKVLASAVDMYGFNKDAWASIVDNGMKRDWSWSQSAKSYVELFERLRH